jgi:hypothetical protein
MDGATFSWTMPSGLIFIGLPTRTPLARLSRQSKRETRYTFRVALTTLLRLKSRPPTIEHGKKLERQDREQY